jgi:hypothetical protein
MTIRKQVEELVFLAPLPESRGADIDLLQRWENALHAVVWPATDDEASVLVELFGPDECYGLAWTLLHLIETAPHLPRLRPELVLRSPFVRTVVLPRWTRR